MPEFYKMDITEAYKELAGSESGLSSNEAKARLKKFGLNQIEGRKKVPGWIQFLLQFKSILIIILIIAAAISFFLGEILDSAVIFLIVILNAVFGYIQERKAEQALEALKKMSAPNALALRDSEMKKIPASELVPGDILILNVGDRVPADCRIIEGINIKADESILTGESFPVSKDAKTLNQDAPLSEMFNMLFSGTTIVYGHGRAIVSNTGMNTEFGKIARVLEQREEKTPLQEKLGVLGKQLGIMILAICALVFLIGFIEGGNPFDMFLTAVALAVAAIPEGLPAVVTITLAIGLQRMAKKNAIIRKLPAVESLGCATVICSDKTGTLTLNEMTVRKIYLNTDIIDISGEGYDNKGDFIKNGAQVSVDDDLKLLLKTGMMCNDASIEGSNIGDPTEIALLVSAKKAGLVDQRKLHQRLSEMPFDSDRKMMSIAYSSIEKDVLYTKGAVEEVLKRCSSVYDKGVIREMTMSDRESIMHVNHQFASSALRVIAFAFKEIENDEKPDEKNLVFLGLQGMIDPPRPEALKAINQCKKAGIRVVMITGDHKDTAVAVAGELGILEKGFEQDVLTGVELESMGPEKFEAIVENIRVYARVSPENKVMITDALKKKGHVIAMTGDGVNDAPALKKADIGVAMGITGTDVSKEASDMVLMDDNFSSIVAAIEEGRVIYDNIRKFVLYLLSCNVGEVLVITSAMIIGFFNPPLLLPLLPIQILWMNLLTDGLPALAMGVEPKEPSVMQRGPRNPKESILNKSSIFSLIFAATMVLIGTMFLFYNNLDYGEDTARTVAFTAIVVFQLFIALSMRSEQPIIKAGFLSNKKLILAVTVSFIFQVAVVYVPLLNAAFSTVPLKLMTWAEILSVSAAIFVALEIKKLKF